MEDDEDSGFRAVSSAQPPPYIVSLAPFSPSPRRLSSHFIQPNRPLRAARQLAWVSLQGRLVGAEEASSARAIGGGLTPEQAVAWELFSPVHRVLIVAVIAVATANIKNNKKIYQLTKSVELRDQVLQSMQHKLDSLCEQLNNIKDQPGTWTNMSINKNVEFVFNEAPASGKDKYFGCGCQLCDHHQPPLKHPMDNSFHKGSSGDEMLKYKIPLSNATEAEERRMSDLSDWNSSVTSSLDIQLNSIAIEQDIYNFKKECDEKDATIKELSTFLHSSKVAGSKRIAELEEIIRRKNMRITRLKKDMLVLEQKVVHLTRLRRPSSASSSNLRELPAMTENLVYDMDSTTSPSSSDTDCPSRNQPQVSVAKTRDNAVPQSNLSLRGKEKYGQAKGYSNLSTKQVERQQKLRPVIPLREKPLNRKDDLVSLPRSVRSLVAEIDLKSRRRAQSGSKAVASQKRWV